MHTAYRNVFAIVRAAVSHRNTWHMWILVKRSRATYAKSLNKRRRKITFEFRNICKKKTVCVDNEKLQILNPNKKIEKWNPRFYLKFTFLCFQFRWVQGVENGRKEGKDRKKYYE